MTEPDKELQGRSVTFLWLIIGGVVFATDPNARLFPWRSAVSFIAGMFAAAVVFGLIGYGLQRATARVAHAPAGRWARFARSGISCSLWMRC